MKTPRFVTEYASFEIKLREQLIKEFGNNKKDFPNFPTDRIQEQIDTVRRIVEMCGHGLIIPRDAMKSIATIGQEA